MDIGRLVALWNDRSLRTADIARTLGVSPRVLYAAATRQGLPRRKGARRKASSIDDGTEMTWRDPTPSEIERMKAELFQKRLNKLRQETSEETQERLLRERKRAAAGCS